jgi:hypothetical protein
MALRTFRPTSPGLRHLVLVDRGSLWKGGPVKMLTEGKTKTGGRNNDGRITTRHIGGGHKQSYRLVDFRRRKHDVPAWWSGRVRPEPPPSSPSSSTGRRAQYILAPQRSPPATGGGGRRSTKPATPCPHRHAHRHDRATSAEARRGGRLARARPRLRCSS